MTKKTVVGLLIGLLGCLGSSLIAAPRLTQSASAIQQQRKGPPIPVMVSRMRATDKELVVTTGQDAPHVAEPPPGMGQLEWISRGYSMVLIGRVKTLDPSLTAAQDWITTAVAFVVESLVKQPEDANVSPGSILTFTQDGGAMRVAGVDVRARLPWVIPFERGGRYLVFCDKGNDGAWRVNQALSYRIGGDDRLMSLTDSEGGGRPAMSGARAEEGQSLAKAIERIRSVKK
jgi:hypothetical protein